MKRVLITGTHGLLGQKLAICIGRETQAELLLTDLQRTSIFNISRFDYSQLDITERSDVKSLIGSYQPDVIIHTAAMTDVDACESERERAWRVNVDGVKNLIIAARRLEQCSFIHLSTDYVFDGKLQAYGEEARVNPLSYYGKSKLAAENALRQSGVRHSIIRTQLLYGTGANIRQNFVMWTLQMLARKRNFYVVDDQIGNPTFADDLAYAILKIAEQSKEGIYHVCGSEALSRFHFAQKIAEVFEMDAKYIKTAKTIDLHQQAQRPMNSTFITLKFESEFGLRLSDATTGLQRLKNQFREGMDFFEKLQQDGGRNEKKKDELL